MSHPHPQSTMETWRKFCWMPSMSQAAATPPVTGSVKNPPTTICVHSFQGVFSVPLSLSEFRLDKCCPNKLKMFSNVLTATVPQWNSSKEVLWFYSNVFLHFREIKLCGELGSCARFLVPFVWFHKHTAPLILELSCSETNPHQCFHS